MKGKHGKKKRRIWRPTPYEIKLRWLTKHKAFKPGSVTIAEVLHDDTCRYWRGWPCNCDPDINLKPYSPSDGH